MPKNRNGFLTRLRESWQGCVWKGVWESCTQLAGSWIVKVGQVRAPHHIRLQTLANDNMVGSTTRLPLLITIPGRLQCWPNHTPGPSPIPLGARSRGCAPRCTKGAKISLILERLRLLFLLTEAMCAHACFADCSCFDVSFASLSAVVTCHARDGVRWTPPAGGCRSSAVRVRGPLSGQGRNPRSKTCHRKSQT